MEKADGVFAGITEGYGKITSDGSFIQNHWVVEDIGFGCPAITCPPRRKGISVLHQGTNREQVLFQVAQLVRGYGFQLDLQNFRG